MAPYVSVKGILSYNFCVFIVNDLEMSIDNFGTFVAESICPSFSVTLTFIDGFHSIFLATSCLVTFVNHSSFYFTINVALLFQPHRCHQSQHSPVTPAHVVRMLNV